MLMVIKLSGLVSTFVVRYICYDCKVSTCLLLTRNILWWVIFFYVKRWNYDQLELFCDKYSYFDGVSRLKRTTYPYPLVDPALSFLLHSDGFCSYPSHIMLSLFVLALVYVSLLVWVPYTDWATVFKLRSYLGFLGLLFNIVSLGCA